MFTFHKKMFDSIECLTCGILWLSLLFEYKRMLKSFMTNAPLGYSDLFLSGFLGSWLVFSYGGFHREKFIVYVAIPVLSPSCMEEFIDFGLQVSVWKFGCQVSFSSFLLFQCGLASNILESLSS